MKNDQWFEPGDKVMRVQNSRPSGIPFKYTGEQALLNAPFGKVFCVLECLECEDGNWIHLCGIENIWFFASNFRKVEEIKLCVAAAEKAKQLTPQHV